LVAERLNDDEYMQRPAQHQKPKRAGPQK
jgi:hypothetical protein